jgi:hypothetical protein
MAAEPIELSDTVLDCLNHLFHGFAVHEDTHSIRAIVQHLHTGPLLAKIIENAPVSNANIEAAAARLNTARGSGRATGRTNSVQTYRTQVQNKVHVYSTRRKTLDPAAEGISFMQNITGFGVSKFIPIFFEFITKRLLTASIGPSTNGAMTHEFMSYGTDKYVTLKDTLTHISGGAYGKVYKGKTNFIYKEMQNKDPSKTETFCRNVFLEAFINVILQHDPQYGAHVGRLVKILKHPHFNRIGRPVQILYFILEPIEYTLPSYLEQPIAPGMEDQYIFPIFYQLGAILEHYHARYGFRHGDLHCGNVMLTRDGKVKLIDFGFSCVSGYTKIAKEPCESYDFLVLLFNFSVRYAFNKDKFKATWSIINEVLSHGINGPNIYSILRILYMEHFSWHLSYYKYIFRPEWAHTLGLIVKERPVLNIVFPKSMHSMTLSQWFLQSDIVKKLEPGNFKQFWLLPGQDIHYTLPPYTYPTPCGLGPLELIEVLPDQQNRGRTRGRNRTTQEATHGRNRLRSRSRNRSHN